MEFPPPYENEVALAESVQVGVSGINIGIIGGGGGGGGGIIGGRGGGSVQHGGATCAYAGVGTLTPVTNAIITPNKSVATTEITPMRIGFFCMNSDIVCFIFECCIKGVHDADFASTVNPEMTFLLNY